MAGSAGNEPNSKMHSGPRILFLSCHLPYPPISGGRRRELELLRRLSADFSIHLVVISKAFHRDLANARLMHNLCDQVEVFATSAPKLGPLDLLEPFQVARHHSPGATGRIGEILSHGEVDLVHVEGFYLLQHVPEWCEVPVLLAEQNIEYAREYQQAIRHNDTPVDVRHLGGCAATRVAERECWERATKLVALTPEDRDAIAAALPGAEVAVVRDGADHVPQLRSVDAVEAVTRPHGPLLVLLANFASQPNRDAVSYLTDEILPLIRAQIPGVQLWLVGNAPPPEICALACAEIRVTGFVPDIVPYLDAADVVVSPLRVGGGTKVRTIEALRRGKAIVSTSIEAQGLAPAARSALELADEPSDFAERVVALLRDRALRRERERRAAEAALKLPSWDEVAGELASIYDELLEHDRQHAESASTLAFTAPARSATGHG